MQLDNIREVIGQDKITKFFANRHINQKLLVNVPDGVYDHVSEGGLGWRMVFIDKFMIHIISDSWVSKGGPSDLPDVLSEPEFGHYPRLP
jgi:hypothetical protein